MNTENKQITLNLSEHDAWQLIALINREISRSEEAWYPYWDSLVKDIRQAIEQTKHNQE